MFLFPYFLCVCVCVCVCGKADDLTQENLTLNDTNAKDLSSASNGEGRRPENVPPNARRMPAPSHRSSRSRDEDERRRRAAQNKDKPGDLIDVFADPSESKPRQRVPRRNSDSSAMDRGSKSLETDEERRRRHKEREARRQHRSRHGSSRHKVPSHRLDVIDKLDVTSVFGTGGMFMSTLPDSFANMPRFPPRWAF